MHLKERERDGARESVMGGEEGMEQYLKEQEERPPLDKLWKCAILSYALPGPIFTKLTSGIL